MLEKWKDIEGYEGLYKVSTLGRVFSFKSNRLLKDYNNPKKYHRVGLTKDGVTKNHSVHRLVAIAFIPNNNPEKNDIVNHKDENKSNNNIDNLEWCSSYYNMKYSEPTAYKNLMESVNKRKFQRLSKQRF